MLRGARETSVDDTFRCRLQKLWAFQWHDFGFWSVFYRLQALAWCKCVGKLSATKKIQKISLLSLKLLEININL